MLYYIDPRPHFDNNLILALSPNLCGLTSEKNWLFWSALVIGLVSIALLFQLHILALATGFYVTYFQVIIFFLHHLITVEKVNYSYQICFLLKKNRSTDFWNYYLIVGQPNRLLLPKQIWSEFNFRFCFVNRE